MDDDDEEEEEEEDSSPLSSPAPHHALLPPPMLAGARPSFPGLAGLQDLMRPPLASRGGPSAYPGVAASMFDHNKGNKKLVCQISSVSDVGDLSYYMWPYCGRAAAFQICLLLIPV